MLTNREGVLAALLARLQPLAANVLCNEVLPERISAGGLIILRDGQPGDPETTLSPLRYRYRHRAELEVVVQVSTCRARKAVSTHPYGPHTLPCYLRQPVSAHDLSNSLPRKALPTRGTKLRTKGFDRYLHLFEGLTSWEQVMADQQDESVPTRCFSVLIVEDEVMIAMDMKGLLEENGHNVVGPSSSVESALRILDSQRPDVAVLDVNLGSQMVTPVAERLRSLEIPFVLCSARSSSYFFGIKILMDAQNIGKPIDDMRLIEALNKAVEQA